MLGGKTLPWAFAKHGFAFGKTQVWRVENIPGFGHRSTQRKWWWQEINEIFLRRKAGAFFIIQWCLEEAKNSKNLRNCLRKTWRRRMRGNLIGWNHKRKVKYGWEGTTTQCLVPNSKKFICKRNVHQIPAGVCQIHKNSSVLRKILRRAFTSLASNHYWVQFSIFNFMPNIHFSKGGNVLWGHDYELDRPTPVIQLWLPPRPTKIETLFSFPPLFAEIAQILRPDW